LVSGSDTGIFPWESVVAVIEVKSQITSANMKEAILNAASVHEIYSNLEERDVLISGIRPKEYMKPFGPIPCYVFAFDSDLAIKDEQDKEFFSFGRKSYPLGKEGIRMLKSRDSLYDDKGKYEEVLNCANGSSTEKESAKRKLDLISNFSQFGNESNIYGICVAGREWTEGHISFCDRVFPQYGPDPIRIADMWNYYWETHFASEDCEEVTRFLYSLLKLSDEMPKCRAHYNVARYFSD
jgi:hypothetical protein